MPNQRISLATKQAIVDAFSREEDYVAAARLLQVKRTTAHSIVNRWIQYGHVERPRGGFRQGRVKVDEEMKDAVVEIVGMFPAFTLKQINEELRRQFPQKPNILLMFGQHS